MNEAEKYKAISEKRKEAAHVLAAQLSIILQE